MSFVVSTIDATGVPTLAYIPKDIIQRFYTYEPVRYENFRAVKEVLEHPLAIFRGVRMLTVGGWCYIGRPEKWCVSEGVFADFPQHLLFAVYLNPLMHVYEFRAESAENVDPVRSLWRERFGELAWKHTS